jgi:hypothetical protein
LRTAGWALLIATLSLSLRALLVAALAWVRTERRVLTLCAGCSRLTLGAWCALPGLLRRARCHGTLRSGLSRKRLLAQRHAGARARWRCSCWTWSLPGSRRSCWCCRCCWRRRCGRGWARCRWRKHSRDARRRRRTRRSRGSRRRLCCCRGSHCCRRRRWRCCCGRAGSWCGFALGRVLCRFRRFFLRGQILEMLAREHCLGLVDGA